MESERRVFPDYDGGSLAELGGTVLDLFDVESDLEALSDDIIDIEREFENVVLLLVDALGKKQWKNFSKGFFQNLEENGELKTITSVFPSATPVTLTSINTGLKPSEHGLLAWDLYFEELGENIYTLPFANPDGEKPQEKHDAGPEILFDGEPYYPELSQGDVDCFAIIKRDIIESEYTELTKKGCEKIEYTNTVDMALQVKRILEEEEGRNFVYAYTSDLDTIDHLRGPGTEDERNQLEMISEALQRNLVENLSERTKEETLLLLTADHGQIQRGEKVDLLEFEKVEDCLEKGPEGKIIPASGNGGRSVFLHLKDERVEELVEFLDRKIEAQVMKTEEALEKGFFGDKPGEKFSKRAGDVVIIADSNKVYWTGTEELEDEGVHGGLNSGEMEVPFAYAMLSDLKKES